MEQAKDTSTKVGYVKKVADKIIAAMENGTAPWVKPWRGDVLQATAPFNPLSEKNYKGINFINLSIEQAQNGWSDPRWLTYKQANSIGAQVRQGEHGTTIQYWKFTEEFSKTDDAGNVVIGADGKPEKITVNLENPQVFYSTVFNASQIDNMPELKLEARVVSFNPIDAAEKILQNSQANIVHALGDKAFYSPSVDKITLPEKTQFASAAGYYSTALHELGHWTGHESRLARDLSDSFGTEGYAREELRAEIASYMLCSELGLDFDPGQHHAYIKSWVSILTDKPTEIFVAANEAAKITQFLQGFNMEKEIEKSATKEVDAPTIEAQTQQSPYVFEEKTFLSVPYTEREAAKAAGAKWDKAAKLWYAPQGIKTEPLLSYIPENRELRLAAEKSSNQQLDEKEILAQFKQALEDRGLIINGDPIMGSDKVIRVPVVGDKGSERSGAYIGYMDGRPAGMIQNFKTGTKDTWSAKGEWQALTKEQEEAQRAKMEQNKLEREQERALKHQQTAAKLQTVFENAKIASNNHPYLVEKGAAAYGLKVDERGNLLMPLRDIDGKLWSAQHIGINGYKALETDGKKEGNFFIIGANNVAEIKNPVLCEGYATGASIYEAIKLPVVVAVDAGNLAAVAQVIHDKYPEKTLLIAADNDIKKELAAKAEGLTDEKAAAKNVGIKKAQDAAEKTNGFFISPRFTQDEISKGYSDFNDLAASRGLGEVSKQFNIVLEKIKEATKTESVAVNVKQKIEEITQQHSMGR